MEYGGIPEMDWCIKCGEFKKVFHRKALTRAPMCEECTRDKYE